MLFIKLINTFKIKAINGSYLTTRGGETFLTTLNQSTDYYISSINDKFIFGVNICSKNLTENKNTAKSAVKYLTADSFKMKLILADDGICENSQFTLVKFSDCFYKIRSKTLHGNFCMAIVYNEIKLQQCRDIDTQLFTFKK